MADLVIDGLTVEYGSATGEVTRPLDGFDMVAPAGSLALLLGPSGSGKTTLLSCLAAILPPARGTVSFGDVTVSELVGKERTLFRRRTVGIVFQAFNLVPSLSAAENVMAPLLAAGRPPGRGRDEGRRAPRPRRAVAPGDVPARRAIRRPAAAGDHRPGSCMTRRSFWLTNPPPTLDRTQVEGVLGLLAGLMDGERVMVIATHDDRVLALGGQRVDLGRRAADGSGAIG